MIEPPRVQERKPTISFDRLLENIAYGQHDAETVASLAYRLARLQHRLTGDDEQLIADYTAGGTISDLIHPLVEALNAATVGAQRAAPLHSLPHEGERPFSPRPPVKQNRADTWVCPYRSDIGNDCAVVQDDDDQRLYSWR